MLNYYNLVNKFWKSDKNSSKLANLTVISISGGIRDKLVKSDSALLPSINSSANINLITTSISDVWLSTDHLCIVWCRQLIIKLTKLLFDLIDPKTQTVISDSEKRTQIIHYHLFNRNRGPTLNQFVPEKINVPKKGNWISNDSRYFAFRKNKVATFCAIFKKSLILMFVSILLPQIVEITYILIPLVPNMVLVLLTNNIIRNDWLFGCNAVLAKVNGTQKKVW
jgi:hypothetical protein